MFRGRHEHAVDAKGRTSLPARFRDVLAAQGESRIVVTLSLDGCLAAYPLREWEAFEQKLINLPSLDEDMTELKRMLVGNAVECDIDKLGRMLLPTALREEAGITRNVLWVGMISYIEIWDPATRATQDRSLVGSEERRQSMRRRATELGLR